MKKRALMVPGLVLLFLLSQRGSLPAQSYQIDCQGTLAAWSVDSQLREYLRTHDCRCPRSDGAPECTPTGSSGHSSSRSSGKKSTKRNTENEIKMMVIEGILTNVFAPQNNTAKQEELRRKQQEELARKQREEEERRRQQEIFERNKEEMLNAFKSGNQNTGLRLKGGGEELLDDPQPASEVPQAGVSGRNRARMERTSSAR